RNAEALELLGAAHAGELENLDRADRAGREDHLAAGARGSRRAVLPPAHARRARAVERDALHQAVGLKPQIGAVEHRLAKAARRPRFWFTWKTQLPSLSPVLKSPMRLMPACSAAAQNASRMSQRTRGASMRNSPPTACAALGPRKWSSWRRKNGSTSSEPQPASPSWRQWS